LRARRLARPNAPVVVLLGSSSTKLVSGALPPGFALHPRRLSPDIDEKAVRRADAGEMTVAIAGAKADELLRVLRVLRDPARCAAALQGKPVPVPDLLCCDQVVVHAGEVFEKAESVAQCKARLQSFGRSGKQHVRRRRGRRALGRAQGGCRRCAAVDRRRPGRRGGRAHCQG
jgi:hypothetical protein